jgi:hypothetical protein
MTLSPKKNDPSNRIEQLLSRVDGNEQEKGKG